REMVRFSKPVKTFLNCTMPALVNINVGSLRGTSGEDGTISWPFSAKKFRKGDLMSLTPVILIQLIQSVGSKRLRKWPLFLRNAFRQADAPSPETVQRDQRLAAVICQAPCKHLTAVDSGLGRVDRLGGAVFLSYLFRTITSGEIG